MDLGPIARKSYRLHEQFAKDPNGKSYGYRKVDTYDVAMKTSDIGKEALNIIWVSKQRVEKAYMVGTVDTCAQVHLSKFTNTLVEDAKTRGASKYAVLKPSKTL
jgi:hypothetical protein